MAKLAHWHPLNRQTGAMAWQNIQIGELVHKTSKVALWRWPNCQMKVLAPAKSPNWRRGASQIAKLAISYVDNISDIAYCEVHTVFTKKVSKFLFPACHQQIDHCALCNFCLFVQKSIQLWSTVFSIISRRNSVTNTTGQFKNV